MEKFFNPESVVMIGVPRQIGTGAYNNMEVMLRYGYGGRIYPVNPKAQSIFDRDCYKSVLDIPETADLAVIAVGRELVPKIFDQCGEKGIRHVVIISQGFADADERGRSLQNELVKKAKKMKIRFVGPNTMGIYNVHCSLNTGFIDHFKPGVPDPIALISQTGMFQTAAKMFSANGFAKAIDLGNSGDVDVVDVLEYLENDSMIKLIVIHMEGIKRGKEFVEIARRVSKIKPIIIFKTGRSEIGAKAAISHSGSLAGEDKIYNAAFKKAGVIRVKNNSELQDAIKGLVRMPPMRGRNIGMMTATGAVGIMAADACDDNGLQLGPVPPRLHEKLLKGMPDWLSVSNPIDIWPIGMINGDMPGVYRTSLEHLIDSDDIHGIVVVWASCKSKLHSDIDFQKIVADLQAVNNSKKPLAFWFYVDDVTRAGKEHEKIPGVGCFPTVERAVAGLAVNYRYYKWRNKIE